MTATHLVGPHVGALARRQRYLLQVGYPVLDARTKPARLANKLIERRLVLPRRGLVRIVQQARVNL
jgi:hypothetical protein